MKKLLFLLLALALCLGVFSAAAAAADEAPANDEFAVTLDGDNVSGSFKYSVNGNGTVTITGYTGGAIVNIPATLNGYEVAAVGASAFAGQAITSVAIPKTVTSIGDNAFRNCTKLTRVTILGDLNDMPFYENRAPFYNAGAASGMTVTFGSGVTRVPARLFWTDSTKNYGKYVKVVKAVIPDSVSAIGNNAFTNCYDLKEVTFGSGLKSIGDGAFASTAITSLTLPHRLSSLGDSCFQNCTRLKTITINGDLNDMPFYENRAPFYNAGASTGMTVKFGSGVTKVPARLFWTDSTKNYGKYVKVVKVVIPDSVSSIGANAFRKCYDLTSVTLGAGLKSIGEGAFGSTGISTVTLPNKLTSLGDGAFRWCTKLKTVTINGDLNDMSWTADNNPFYNAGAASGMTVKFGSGVSRIPARMFSTDSTQNYGEYVKVSKVVIPKSVTQIGADAFRNCYDLKNVTYAGTRSGWYGISIADGNGRLTGASIVYEGDQPAQPAKKTGWQKISGKWYYYRDGAPVKGWQKLSGKWYYFNSAGVMQTGWQKIGRYWYCFDSSGAMYTGWQKLGRYWYCFDASGAMLTGWQKVGGCWYYFETSGAMHTGWLQSGRYWYYFDPSGAMHTGWLQLGGYWYYFKSSGVMAANETIGNSTFDSSGRWIG